MFVAEQCKTLGRNGYLKKKNQTQSSFGVSVNDAEAY
jgi:hypothetical protein